MPPPLKAELLEELPPQDKVEPPASRSAPDGGCGPSNVKPSKMAVVHVTVFGSSDNFPSHRSIPSSTMQSVSTNGEQLQDHPPPLLPPPSSSSLRKLNYDDYLTAESLKRTPSPLKAMAPYVGKPGLIFLGGGLPTPDVFPLANLTASMRDGSELNLHGNELLVAQQYQGTYGLQELRNWCRRHVMKVHAPPNPDVDVMLSAGNTDALDKLCRLLLEPGDIVLMEEYTYAQAISTFAPLGVRIVPVAIDEGGIIPSDLDRVTTKLRSEHQESGGQTRPPKIVLYTVPKAQNPTGAFLASHRYAEILEVADRHDFLILEDDAYFYLQFGEGAIEGESDEDGASVPGLQGLGPTFLSTDRQGRVLRMDTFSKCILPGFRVGFVSGPSALLHKYALLGEVSTQMGSAFSCGVLNNMLAGWGEDGFERHVKSIQLEYRRRRNVLVLAMQKYLGGLAEWTVPKGGMFLWLRANGVRETADLFPLLVEKGVLLMPGKHFTAPRDAATSKEGVAEEGSCPYFRISFSFTAVADLEEGMRRFRDVLLSVPSAA